MPRKRYYKNNYVSIAEKERRDNEKEVQERMSQEDSRSSHLGIHGLTKFHDTSKEVRSITWESINQFRQETNNMIVTIKADGLRVLILCDFTGNLFSILNHGHPNQSVQSLGLSRGKMYGYVLEAELVKVTCGNEPLYLCFDVIRLLGQNKAAEFNLLKEIVSDIDILSIVYKSWFPMSHGSSLLLQKFPFNTDGLIFTSLQTLTKWKFKASKQVSIDFLLGSPISVDGGNLLLNINQENIITHTLF